MFPKFSSLGNDGMQLGIVSLCNINYQKKVHVINKTYKALSVVLLKYVCVDLHECQ